MSNTRVTAARLNIKNNTVKPLLLNICASKYTHLHKTKEKIEHSEHSKALESGTY